MEPTELSGTGMSESHHTTQAVMEEGLLPLSSKISPNVSFPKGTAQQQGLAAPDIRLWIPAGLWGTANVPAMRNVLQRTSDMTSSSDFSTHLESI